MAVMPDNASVEAWIIHAAVHAADGRTTLFLATLIHRRLPMTGRPSIKA
jgi:hypothetical protein